MQDVLIRWCRVFAVGLCVFLFSTGAARLQAQATSANVGGVVLDQAGKTVPNAAVVVKNDSTGAVTAVTTGADGRFSAPGLPLSTYTIEVSASGFAKATRTGVQIAGGAAEDLSIPLSLAGVNESVTVEAVASVAAQLAPSGNTLDATSARTEISQAFIQNFTSPVSDFAEIVSMAPGTFSLNPNGVGLGQGKIYFRGFQDGQFTMTFDGIPFEDTNTPTHHSWANFPAQWLGGTDFDRSPGQASSFGPTNFGGSINLESKDVPSTQDIRATGSYGSFNTRLLEMDYDSGQFGPGNKNSLLIDLHQMLSDGYQTYNYQKRVAGSGKYQYKLSDKTTITMFGGLVDDWNNTPNTTNATRAQIAQFGDNFLLNNDPTSGYFYGYNYYHIQTDFEYMDFNTDMGDGWRFDDKAYTTRYWNKQNYQNGATLNFSLASPSGVDKLNGYRHAGNTSVLSKESKWGIFRTGFWYDWSYTDRYQYPSNVLTWADTPLPNFHEHFVTQALHPFAEYEWHATSRLVITAGIKDAHYTMALNQYQDNGKIVGCLGGSTLVKANTTKNTPPACVGGTNVDFVSHSIGYNNWLPTLTARYRIQRNWSAYAQFAEGSVIPPSAVFDTPGGNVLAPPQPTLAKTYQVGSVLKFNRLTLDADAYYVHFQNGFDSYIDPTSNESVFVSTGPSNTKGIEAESNIAIGYGLSLYLNGSIGSAKYQTGPSFPNGGEWVADTPGNIETFGLTWQRKNWDVGIFDKRVGQMYNDNQTLPFGPNKIPYPVDQAITINPFSLTNLYINYTVKNSSFLRGSKLGLAINNLFDNHNVVGITPFTAPTATAAFVPNALDQMNLLPGRSVTVSLTVGYAPKR